jgi:hypothetical protein
MIKYLKYLFLFVVYPVSSGLFAQKSDMSKYIEQIDSLILRRTLSTLASDRFEGRGTAQQGGVMTQLYIADYLDSCNVIPAVGTKSFFQNIECVRRVNVEKKRSPVNDHVFTNEYSFENSYRQDTTIYINEIIFVAQGCNTDIEPVDVENKTVMILDYSKCDWNSRNPTTVINIVQNFIPTVPEISETIYFPPTENKYKYNKVNISARLADKLLESTGKTLLEIVDDVRKSGSTKIFTLKTNVEFHGNVRYKSLNVNNIVGIIEGSDLANEYIVLSAHHDHMGIVNDRVYNGADDNASGVACVLETARLLAKAKREGHGCRRSVIALFPAAEEMGLIGSKYYVKNPIYPLTETKACINVDMVGRIDDRYNATKDDYIYFVNDETSNNYLLQRANIANIDSIVINASDLNTMFTRSDHYNFAVNNIPAVLISGGLHNDYHTPDDDTEWINFDAIWKRCRFIFSLVWNLANVGTSK